jgi:hypothetical protein
MVTTVRPNARATPVNPIPSDGKAAANKAAPHPPKTSQKEFRDGAFAEGHEISFVRNEPSFQLWGPVFGKASRLARSRENQKSIPAGIFGRLRQRSPQSAYR